MRKLNIHRVWLAILMANLAMALFAIESWCRLKSPPSLVDVRDLAEKAPLVFRGHVLTITRNADNRLSLNEFVGLAKPGARVPSIAKIQVDRWYRGKGSTEALLRFAYYGGPFADGHDCIDFRPETYWIVFAVQRDGRMEMVDDCEGALTVSALLGPDLGNADWPAQMEADFVAGLNDEDSAARLASIQRLGGLKLLSSRDALHRVIETGNDAESKWAVYGALRTGDLTVLPRVRRLLANGDRELPEFAIAMELQDIDFGGIAACCRAITDSSAVADLIAILESAPGELTRTRVLFALGERLKDPRAVPSLAAHLSDPDPQARYYALVGLKNITHEDACTLSRDWQQQDIEPQVSRCKNWWEQGGKFRNWPQS